MPPPTPPPGFQLDRPRSTPPAPPAGFSLDAPPQPPAGFTLDAPATAAPPIGLGDELGGADPAAYENATDFGRLVYDSANSGTVYDRDWLAREISEAASVPPPPPPGFTLDAGGPGWIDVEPQPLADDEITTFGESLGQTMQEWGDVIGGLPTKVRASVAGSIANLEAMSAGGRALSAQQELEKLEAGPSPFFQMLDEGRSPEELAVVEGRRARMRELLESSKSRELERLGEAQAITAETGADLQPTEGATMAQRALEQAAISAPPSAVALATGIVTRNPALAAATMQPTSAASGFGDLLGEFDARARQQEAETLRPQTEEERFGDIEKALKGGMIEGDIEFLTEVLPLGKVLKQGTPAVQRLAELLLAELPGETLATLTQEINREIALQPEGEATLDAVFKGLEEGGKQIPETLIATILGSAGQTAPIAAAEAVQQRLASRSQTPQATRVEPTMEGAPETEAADVDVEAQAGARFGDELETTPAPEARRPSAAWTADTSAAEGVPFAFLGPTPEEAAGFLIEEGGKIKAVTAAGDEVGSYDGPDAAAIALEDAVKGVQTPAPEPGLGDELGELGAPAMPPQEATPGEVVTPSFQQPPATERQALEDVEDIIESSDEGQPAGLRTWKQGARARLEQMRNTAPDGRPVIQGELAVDRRQNRKRVADMNEAELRQSLLTHELTGIPNRRAYEESPKLASQTAVDVDSLKWVNDNMGHDSGNELLRAVGEAIRAETPNAYHLSGDEFAIQSATDEEAAAIMQRVNDRLAGAVISVTMPDGEVVTLSGMGVSYGSGKDLGAADAALQTSKTQREARGERASRGEQPPGASRFVAEEGGQGDEGRAPAPPQGLGDTATEEEPTGEHVTLAGPFAHRERADVEKPQLGDELAGDEDLELGQGPGGGRLKPTTNTQNLEIAVQQMLGKAKNAPKYRFVKDDGLPADVQKRMRLQEGFEWRAAFDPVSHRVWLNSDTIGGPAEAAWYAMHEIAGHYGIKGAIGQLGAPDRTRINQALNLVAQNPYIDGLAEAYQQDRQISRGQALEEALSELAAAIRTGNFARLERQYGLKTPGTFKGEKKTEAKAAWRRAFDRFVAAIKTIVKKLTGYNVSDQQVLELLEGAWRYVQTGEQLPSSNRRSTSAKSDGIDLADEVDKVGKDVERILGGSTKPAEAQFNKMIGTVVDLIHRIDGKKLDPGFGPMAKDLRAAAMANLDQLLDDYAERFGELYDGRWAVEANKLQLANDEELEAARTDPREERLADRDVDDMLAEGATPMQRRARMKQLRENREEAATDADQKAIDRQIKELDEPDLASEEQLASPAFKKWFGDSVVTETGKAGGEPKVMYHGTTRDFGKFEHGDVGFHFGTEAHAGWRLADKTGDEATEGNVVMPVYLSIKNPLRTEDAGTWHNVIDAYTTIHDGLLEAGARANAFAETFLQRLEDYETGEQADAIYRDMRKWLEKNGFDGIVYANQGEREEEGELEDSYIALRPTQIKSAVGNRGTYDPTQEDVSLADAYHGSGAKFDKFSLEHVGSGEGAQAYGWGLYFAENPSVADYYRGNLSSAMWHGADGNAITMDSRPAARRALDWMIDDPAITERSSKGKIEKALRKMATRLEEHAKFLLGEGMSGDAYGDSASAYTYSSTAKQLRELADEGITIKRGGATYEVEIPDEAIDRMASLEEPLNKQPKNVQKAFHEIEDETGIAFKWDQNARIAMIALNHIDSPSDWVRTEGVPDDAAAHVKRLLGDEYRPGQFSRNTSMLLRKYGVAGNTYVEGKSRDLYQRMQRSIEQHGSKEKALEFWRDKYARIEKGEFRDQPGISAEAAGELLGALEYGVPRNIVVYDDNLITIKKIDGKPVTPKESREIVARSIAQAGQDPQGELFAGPRRARVEGERRKQTPAPENKAQKDLFGNQLELLEKAIADSHVTETSAFKRWFGKSKVVDDKGKPLVVYHGTRSTTDFRKFDVTRDVGYHFGTPAAAAEFVDNVKWGGSRMPRILPVYLSIKNPIRMEDLGEWDSHSLIDELKRVGIFDEETHERYRDQIDSGRGSLGFEGFRRILEKAGYDGVVYKNEIEGHRREPFTFGRDKVEIRKEPQKAQQWVAYGPDGRRLTAATGKESLEERLNDLFEHGDIVLDDSWIAMRPNQIKSAIGNRGTFDPDKEEIDLATGKKPPTKGKGGGVQKISWQPGKNYVEMYRSKGAPGVPARAKLREGELEIPKEPIRAQHVMELFQRLFKVKIYEGKPFSLRGALGYFRPSNFEVRNKYRNDLEVAAHEMFHWLDRTYPTLRKLYHLRRYADELKGVSYDEKKIFEGFAEFGRLFLTQESEAIERLPTFYEAFVKETGDVGILDKLEQVQKLMHQWYLQGAEARGRSKIGKGGMPVMQRLSKMADGFIDRAIASSLDARQAAKVIERETLGDKAFGDAASSPYKSIRLLGGARSTINTWLNYGTLKWSDKGDLERNGIGLKQIFEPIAGVFDEAMGYFVAQRADELRKYGKENLLAKDETEALRERARKTGKLEQIQRAHEQYQQYTKRLLSFAVQSGILSPETRDTWEQLYANYVPFYRVAEKFGTLDPRMAGTTRGGLFRRLTGGTANINDVFENITLNTATIVHAALKNVAMRQLFAAIESSPVGQRYAVRIPTSTEVRKVSMEQIERVLKDFAKEAARQGMTGVADKIEALELSQLARALGSRSNDLGQMTMSDIQDQATFFFTGRPPTIPDKQMVLVRGKPRWFQIGDPMLWDMLVDMNYHQPLGLAEKVFGVAKRTLTRGVTLSPEFQFANMLRDTFNAYAMSKGGQTPIVDALKAIRDIWKESPDYVDFLANGGGFGNATGDEAKKLRVRIHASGHRWLSTPAELLDYWDKWGQSFELATRLAEYKRIRAKGGTRREAAFEGREISTDFAMRGHSQLARFAGIALPFFNARLQGLYRIEREINEKRGRQSPLRGERAFNYAMKAFTGLTIPSLLVYWFLNRGDDDYEELGEELKSLNTVIPGPDGTVLLIPRPFETGALFMEVPVRLLQYAEEKNGEQLVNAMMFMIANTFNFDPTPQLVAPPLRIMRNQQWNGLPVVPRSLENVEPREQFQPWTPDTYKRIGAQFNVSPLKLQALVEGYLGTIGTYGVAASDTLMQPPDSTGEEVNRRLSQWPLLRRFMREAPYTNTSFESRFYDMLNEVERVVDTARKMRREARGDDLDAYLSDQERAALFAISGPATDTMELAADLNAQMRAIRNDATLSGEEKLEQILELQEEQNTLFRDAMAQFDEAMLEEARRALEQGGQ